MGKQVNSVDIQVLDFSVLFDITGDAVITLANASTAANPGNLKWAFEIKSPSGTPIHAGNFTTPDVTGNWNTDFVKNSGFPKFGGIIELGTYTITAKAKDAAGEIYELSKTVLICRPTGNSSTSKNLFGQAIHSIKTKCQTNQLFVEDKSSYSYGGVVGSKVSLEAKLLLPPDNTGTVPAPVSATALPYLYTLGVSGEGYQLFHTAIYTFDFGDLVTVKVKYIGRSSFAVHCDFDPGPLVCEVTKLVDSIENGTCTDRDNAEEKLKLINPKLSLMLIGIMYPQANCSDPWKLAEEIKEIGGFSCDCCASGSAGVNQGTLIADLGLNFLVSAAGDITASWSLVGSNLTLNIADITYVVQMNPAYTGTAISVASSAAGTTKTYTINVDTNLLATEILNEIESNTTLLNQLVQMVQGDNTVSLDPMCLKSELGSSGNTCDYQFTIPLGASPSVFINAIIANGQTIFPIGYVTSTLIADLQTKLNSLNLGTFVVTYNAGTTSIVIASTANTNNLEAFLYILQGSDQELSANVVKNNCTGYQAYTVQSVLQALIKRFCNMAGNAIQSGCPISIDGLVRIAGSLHTTNIAGSNTMCDLVTVLVKEHNKLVAIVQAVKEVNCDNIQDVFSTDADAFANTDRLYGNVNGICKGISTEKVFSNMLNLALQNQTIKDLFCKAVAACGKAVCVAVTNATATLDTGTGVLETIITNNGSVKYRVGYRLIIVGGTLGPIQGVQDIAATAGATTTHQWTGITPGQYQVVIQAVCGPADLSAEYTVNTSACSKPTSFTVVQNGSNFEITWAATSPHVRLSIIYPNFSTFKQDYAVGASPLTLPIPSGLSGEFIFDLQGLCDGLNGVFVSEPITPHVQVLVPKENACPMVTNASITSISTTGITVEATKPSSTVTPASYRLILYTAGGAKNYEVAAPGGTLITWTITDLTEDKVYMAEIVSICSTGRSEVYPLGSFATLASGADNSSITNAGGTNVTQPLMILINDVLHYVKNDGLAASATDNFITSNQSGVTVKVKACGFTMADGTITSDAVVYNPSSVDGDTLIFSNVIIKGGMTVSFTD